MPIPPVTHFRVPLLQLLGDGVELPLAEAAHALADVFKLTEEERSAVLSMEHPESSVPRQELIGRCFETGRTRREGERALRQRGRGSPQ